MEGRARRGSCQRTRWSSRPFRTLWDEATYLNGDHARCHQATIDRNRYVLHVMSQPGVRRAGSGLRPIVHPGEPVQERGSPIEKLSKGHAIPPLCCPFRAHAQSPSLPLLPTPPLSSLPTTLCQPPTRRPSPHRLRALTLLPTQSWLSTLDCGGGIGISRKPDCRSNPPRWLPG